MRRLLAVSLVLLLVAGMSGTIAVLPTALGGSYPTPSPYPIAWQLDFKHKLPRRIVIELPGEEGPVAYYYITYTVTNKTGQERTFYPNFVMLTRTGKLVRSDKGIPPQVFGAIKSREGNKFLERATQLAGEIRLGEDQARDGVAIWREAMPDMGRFSVFVGGLSGEHVMLKNDKGETLKDKDGNPVILRKTLRLNYIIRGDEIYPGEDEINKEPEEWVMR